MRFVTFQPYDWRTTERYKGYKDIYWDILQFNPIWCIPAESLEQAFINSLITYPVTPEQAIFYGWIGKKCIYGLVVEKF